MTFEALLVEKAADGAVSASIKELDDSLRKGGDKHSPTDKSWFDKAKEKFFS